MNCIKYNHVLIGEGEVGRAIKLFFKDKFPILTIEKNTDIIPYSKVRPTYMHVAIPYSKNFTREIIEYKKFFKPKYILIYSTVKPGTTREIGSNAVHSPIEGRHPNLAESFGKFIRFVSGKKAKEVARFFSGYNLLTRTFDKPEITELGKLLSTTRYGLNIIFAQLEQDMCERENLDFKQVVLEYQEMYNWGYKKMGEERFQQQILTPPEEKIGGHCVIKNSEILYDFYTSSLIQEVRDFNKKYEEEKKS